MAPPSSRWGAFTAYLAFSRFLSFLPPSHTNNFAYIPFQGCSQDDVAPAACASFGEKLFLHPSGRNFFFTLFSLAYKRNSLLPTSGLLPSTALPKTAVFLFGGRGGGVRSFHSFLPRIPKTQPTSSFRATPQHDIAPAARALSFRQRGWQGPRLLSCPLLLLLLLRSTLAMACSLRLGVPEVHIPKLRSDSCARLAGGHRHSALA
eukprot:1136726-Pelagomonas_calceolata.AAC.3